MKKTMKTRGITLIALVITIIVLLILAGISISMLTGENGLLTKASLARDNTRAGGIQEEIDLAVAQNEIYNYSEGSKTTRDGLIEKLHDENRLTDEEYNLLKGTEEVPGVNKILIGTIEVDFSALGSVPGNLTLGAVYDSGDLEIGDKLTYSSNGQSNWIVFGKDTSGNILITTKLPIDNAFTLHGGAEAWLKYESDTDSTYGLNKACSTYGGTVQGTPVTSRSIKMEDINYVAGLTQKTVTADGNTYNIQSFDTYTFGTTNNYSAKKVNYWYPVLSGGTLANGTGSGFWKRPTAENETTFPNNWYGYYCNWDSGEYLYSGVETNGNEISAASVGLNTDKLKYIWGGNSEETCYNEYVVASRSVGVYSDGAGFRVANVGGSGVDTGNCGLCDSNSSNANDGDVIGSYGVRPVVILPSSLLVEEVETGVYDLAE